MLHVVLGVLVGIIALLIVAGIAITIVDVIRERRKRK